MRRARKTTVASGTPIDLEKVAAEQQIKKREEMEKILAAVKAKHREGQVAAMVKKSKGNGMDTTLDHSGGVTRAGGKRLGNPKNKKRIGSGQMDFDKVTGKVDLCYIYRVNSQWGLEYVHKQNMLFFFSNILW